MTTTDCGMFRTCTPSTAYKTDLFAVDEGLCGRNVLQSVDIDLFSYINAQDNSLAINNVAMMSLYNIFTAFMIVRQLTCWQALSIQVVHNTILYLYHRLELQIFWID